MEIRAFHSIQLPQQERYIRDTVGEFGSTMNLPRSRSKNRRRSKNKNRSRSRHLASYFNSSFNSSSLLICPIYPHTILQKVKSLKILNGLPTPGHTIFYSWMVNDPFLCPQQPPPLPFGFFSTYSHQHSLGLRVS